MLLFDPVIFDGVALVAATVSVDELPLAIEVGLALMVTVGADAAVTVTVAWRLLCRLLRWRSRCRWRSRWG